jgi:ABC-type sulfate transport system permease component
MVPIAFVGFWLINLSTCAVLAFQFDLKLLGIRLALLVAMIFITSSFYMVIEKQDMDEISKKA